MLTSSAIRHGHGAQGGILKTHFSGLVIGILSATLLSGCTGTTNVSCEGLEPQKLEDALSSQESFLSWQEENPISSAWLGEGFVSDEVRTSVLNNKECFDWSFVSQLEKRGLPSALENQPRSGFPPLDFSIAANVRQPNTKDLKRALSFFDFVEEDGDSYDYSLEWSSTQRMSSVLSDAALESNRERDRVSFNFYTPSISVDMNGEVTWMSTVIGFTAADEFNKALCNGVMFEVLERSFFIAGRNNCEGTDYLGEEYDLDIFNYDQFEPTTRHLVTLLASNPFKVKVVDIEGTLHEFTFNNDGEYLSNPKCDGSSYCALSAQDLFTIALDAEEAIAQGLGY